MGVWGSFPQFHHSPQLNVLGNHFAGIVFVGNGSVGMGFVGNGFVGNEFVGIDLMWVCDTHCSWMHTSASSPRDPGCSLSHHSLHIGVWGSFPHVHHSCQLSFVGKSLVGIDLVLVCDTNCSWMHTSATP
jgi:hypothetical protein